jgi:hypothetical protein
MLVYMVNDYEEDGPTNIVCFFKKESVIQYFMKILDRDVDDVTEVTKKVQELMDSPQFNEACRVTNGWGGFQLTVLLPSDQD